MPDVTFELKEVPQDEERLENAILRLGSVNLVNVDTEKKLLAVSYEGAEAELEEIESSLSEFGIDFEPSPGTRRMEE